MRSKTCGWYKPILSKQVVMYATSWCPYCQQARNYFREQGIPYIEYDIEKNEEARRAYKNIGAK